MTKVARPLVAAAVLVGAVVLLLPGVGRAAETVSVAVIDNGYRDGNADGDGQPSHTVIRAGDTVVWTWAGDNSNPHTVTSRADAPVAFDSDGRCDPADTSCREPGARFAVRFDEPGTYPYFCKVHSGTGLIGMTGTIRVEEAPPPDDEPGSGEPDQGEQPPTDEQRPDDEGEPAPPPQEEPPQDETAAGSGDRPPVARRAPAPGFGVQQQPQPEAGVLVAPEVEPEPSFSPFPSEPDLPDASETDEVAVNVPTRSARDEGLVVGIAIVSLIGTAGVFSKVVLFGPPWG